MNIRNAGKAPMTVASLSVTGVTALITFWGTQVVGNAMSGNFNYDASFTGIPGVAAIRARLIGLNK